MCPSIHSDGSLNRAFPADDDLVRAVDVEAAIGRGAAVDTSGDRRSGNADLWDAWTSWANGDGVQVVDLRVNVIDLGKIDDATSSRSHNKFASSPAAVQPIGLRLNGNRGRSTAVHPFWGPWRICQSCSSGARRQDRTATAVIVFQRLIEPLGQKL